MAPTKQAPQAFSKDEKVLCFHHEMLYEAKILDVAPTEAGDGHQYKIHYKGWKATWDDWVPVDRIRKYNQENIELAQQLLAQAKSLSQQKSGKGAAKKGAAGGAGAGTGGGGRGAAQTESARGSEERGGAAQGGRGPRRTRDFELEQEESFHSRPSIKLFIPDHIKAVLVDDWENITKNNQLVPIPHPHPASEIFEDYLAQERPTRTEGSASLDILEETFAGLREYFERTLSRVLLYRFERVQYHEVREMWQKAKDGEPKTVCDSYGPEHLCRLLVSLEELVAQTNMDHQSVSRLREELTKFTEWLGKNANNYFVTEYETPSSDYIEKTKF